MPRKSKQVRPALILGTTGAVGGAAARIAHQLGVRVIGTARKASDIPAAGVLPVDDWIDLQAADLATAARKLTNGRGADVVFDVVGFMKRYPKNKTSQLEQKLRQLRRKTIGP